MWRILFLGQKPLGEHCFKILINKYFSKKYKVCGVVSNKSINNWWNSNEIYKLCKNKKIDFIDSKYRNNKKILNLIKKKNINLLVSVQHPWIIPMNILKFFERNSFNLHNAN